jgi:hypothetical protein
MAHQKTPFNGLLYFISVSHNAMSFMSWLILRLWKGLFLSHFLYTTLGTDQFLSLLTHIYFILSPYLHCILTILVWPWRWCQHICLKLWFPPTELHGITIQKATMWRKLTSLNKWTLLKKPDLSYIMYNDVWRRNKSNQIIPLNKPNYFNKQWQWAGQLLINSQKVKEFLSLPF